MAGKVRATSLVLTLLTASVILGLPAATAHDPPVTDGPCPRTINLEPVWTGTVAVGDGRTRQTFLTVAKTIVVQPLNGDVDLAIFHKSSDADGNKICVPLCDSHNVGLLAEVCEVTFLDEPLLIAVTGIAAPAATGSISFVATAYPNWV